MWFDGHGRHPGCAEVRLQNVQGSCLAAARHGIHENHRLVGIQKGVNQIEPADAEIMHMHVSRQRALRQTPGDFDTESVVPEEDIANAGDENARGTHDDYGSLFCFMSDQVKVDLQFVLYFDQSTKRRDRM